MQQGKSALHISLLVRMFIQIGYIDCELSGRDTLYWNIADRIIPVST